MILALERMVFSANLLVLVDPKRPPGGTLTLFEDTPLKFHSLVVFSTMGLVENDPRNLEGRELWSELDLGF